MDRLRAFLFFHGMWVGLAGVSTGQEVDPIEQALTACLRNERLLSSVVARAKIQRRVWIDGEDEPLVTSEARAQISYQRPKYLISIQYDLGMTKNLEGIWVDSKPNDRVLLFDGTRGFLVESSPDGCQGTIHDGQGEPAALSRAALSRAGFPSNHPVFLWRDAQVCLGLMRDSSYQRLRSGGFIAKTARIECCLLGQFGFDLRRIRMFAGDSPVPMAETHLTWARAENVWYVQRMVSTENRRGRARGVSTSTIEFEVFEANAHVDPSTFSLQAMGVPAGTRFSLNSGGRRGGDIVFNGEMLLEPLSGIELAPINLMVR